MNAAVRCSVRSFAHVLRSNFRYLWILCLLLAGLPFLAAAQEATIVGTVTDPAGSVVLNVNDRTRVDFQMKMGTKSETVSVEANAIQVQADSSEQSSLISGTQIS